MRFFIDNNLSTQLAAGMKAFGEDVIHLQDEFDENTPDTEWLEFIGKNDLFLITRDYRIRYNPLELSVLRRYNVGAFFLGGKSRTRWQLIQQLVKSWPRIKEYARKTHRPFAFQIRPNGTTFSRIQL